MEPIEAMTEAVRMGREFLELSDEDFGIGVVAAYLKARMENGPIANDRPAAARVLLAELEGEA